MGRIPGYILGGTLFVLGFLGEIYFGHYKGSEISNPFFYRIVSWLVSIAGGAIFAAASRDGKNNLSKIIDDWKENLRENGNKIIVNFRDCEVKSNFYYEEVAREQSSEAQFYNALIGQSEKNVEQQSRHSSVIIFKHTDARTGQELVFVSPLIRKEKVSLTFRISEQKQTTIYVNPNNNDDYFFDVDFLYKS